MDTRHVLTTVSIIGIVLLVFVIARAPTSQFSSSGAVDADGGPESEFSGRQETLSSSWSVHQVAAPDHLGYRHGIHIAEDGTVYVAYKMFEQEVENGETENAQLRVARSTDNGETWSVQRVDDQAKDRCCSSSLFAGEVSIDGSKEALYAAYINENPASSGKNNSLRVAITSGSEGGWETHTVETDLLGTVFDVSVVDPETAYIAFNDLFSENGETGMSIARTTDGGETWTTHPVENVTDTGSGGRRLDADLETSPDGSNLYLTYYNPWPEKRYVHFAKSTDTGETWDVQIIEKPPASATSGGSLLVLDEQTLLLPHRQYAISGQGEGVDASVYAVGTLKMGRSVDQGETWVASIPNVQSVNLGVLRPRISKTATGTIYMSYARFISPPSDDDPSGVWDLILTQSRDSGVTWTEERVPPLSNLDRDVLEAHPRLAASNEQVVVLFRDPEKDELLIAKKTI